MPASSVSLLEWESSGPASDHVLAGRPLASDSTRHAAEQLGRTGRLEVLKLAGGLALRAGSFVGSIALDDLRITIRPKIESLPLWHLLQYAQWLRQLDLHPPLDYARVPHGFQDLLIHQLSMEASELLARALHRQYRRTIEMLASPRGRIDFQFLVRARGTATGALPCIHQPRLEDSPLNQVLLAGMRLAVHLTADVRLRTRTRRLAAMLADRVSVIRLNPLVLRRARQALSRLTVACEPALTLIELLTESMGISLEDGEEAALELLGFLVDMDRFLQALRSRFLRVFLDGYRVEDDHRLKRMMRYRPLQNPRRRRSPAPRPDYVVRQQGQIVSILDAPLSFLPEASRQAPPPR